MDFKNRFQTHKADWKVPQDVLTFNDSISLEGYVAHLASGFLSVFYVRKYSEPFIAYLIHPYNLWGSSLSPHFIEKIMKVRNNLPEDPQLVRAELGFYPGSPDSRSFTRGHHLIRSIAQWWNCRAWVLRSFPISKYLWLYVYRPCAYCIWVCIYGLQQVQWSMYGRTSRGLLWVLKLRMNNILCPNCYVFWTSGIWTGFALQGLSVIHYDLGTAFCPYLKCMKIHCLYIFS